MSKIFTKLVIVITTLLFLSCVNGTTSDNDDDDDNDNPAVEKPATITVNFEYGTSLTPIAYRNIYTVWMENSAKSYIQNIFICEKLTTEGALTGTALPFWKLNVLPKSPATEVDSVTAATTANSDFTVSAVQKDSSIRKFTLFFEVDRSFEANDWFNDQPALLYYAEIDLDQNVTEYELKLLGWTPNDETTTKNSGTPVLITGTLDKVTKYITNKRAADGSFGETDTNSSTKMVKKITAKVTYTK